MNIYVRIFLIGLFFFFQYGLNNILVAFETPLREAFNVSSESMGFLASLYFWGDIVILLPAGWMLDQLGARRIVLGVMALSVICIILPAIWPNYYLFAASRFVEGICGAFGMIGALKLGTFYMSKKKLALMSGIITTLGMFGSFMSSMPLNMLAEHFNWRIASLMMGALGAVIFALIFLATQAKPTQQVQKGATLPFKKIVKTFVDPQVLLNGLYVCFLNLPIYLLAALWGAPMLQALTGISRNMAALIVSMIFIGNMFGAPFFGFLSDHFKKRKMYLYIGALVSALMLATMLFTGMKPMALAFVLFLVLGFATSTQSLCFAIVMEQNSPRLAGIVSAILAMISALGGAIGQPLFGAALSWLQNSGLSEAESYLKMIYLFLGALVIVAFSAWRIKEK